MAFDKDTVRIIIFEADTPAGKAFDVGLIVCILCSVLAVMLDSVAAVHAGYSGWLYSIECLSASHPQPSAIPATMIRV